MTIIIDFIRGFSLKMKIPTNREEGGRLAGGDSHDV